MLHITVLKSAEQPKIIPKQNKIAFISNQSGLPQLWLLDENKKVTQYGEFNDVVRAYYPSPQGDLIIVAVDHQGNEKQQLYLLEDATKKVTPLVHEQDHFHHFGGWSPSGDQFTFSSNRRQEGFFDIFIMDVKTGTYETIFEYDGVCYPLAWLPDGQHILLNIPETNIDQAYYKLHLDSGDLTRIGQENILARYASLQLTSDGEKGYMLSDVGEETLYICSFSFDRPDELVKVYHNEKWDIEEIRLSPDHQIIAYTLNEGGFYQLGLYDVQTGDQKEVEGLPKGVMIDLHWLNEGEVIFTLKTPTCPGDLWKYSVKTGQLERLTKMNKKQAIEQPLTDPTLQTFTSFDGLEVPYFYYEQKPQIDRPVVIYVHGGPENQTRAEYHPTIQNLIQQGFIVVAPNIRGSRGYGRTYLSLDDQTNRMDAVKDLVALREHLIQAHDVHPHQVGIMGISYGGFMVLSSLSHYPDLWGAGVDLVGMSHLKTFFQTIGAWRRSLRAFEYGDVKEHGEFFEKIAPLNHSHKIEAPLLVFHGQNDIRVPINESEQLVHKMRKEDQSVRYIVFENEGHVTQSVANRKKETEAIVKFFKEHLMHKSN